MRFSLRPGVRRLFRLPLTSSSAPRDADDELASLIASRVEQLIARGASQDDAYAEALRRLGASLDDARLQLHTSATRRERRLRVSQFIDGATQDIRYAARGLIRRPAFTVVSVLTLALGIGGTAAIFSAVNAMLLRPLPYARPSELMQIRLILPAEGGRAASPMGWSYPMFRMLRETQHAFADLAVYSPSQFTLTSGDVERVTGEYVGASYLRVLGLSPSRGRDFDRALDAHPGGPRQAIVSYALWQRRFGADPSVIGRAVDVEREAWTIIGVGPSGFRGLSGQADIFLPAMTEPADRLSAAWFPFWLVGRRAPGVTAGEAAAAVRVLGTRVASAFPNPMGTVNWEVTASPLDDGRLEPALKRSLLMLFGAVALVLLIACVNVANLVLGRATGRSREIAVRVAIGAGRMRLVRLLVTESLMLALVGGVASVAVAALGVYTFRNLDPTAVSGAAAAGATAFGAVPLSSISLDWRTLTFALVVSLVVGVLFGLAPALAVGRGSVVGTLKKDHRAGGAGAGRRTLIVAEVSLALILLVGSGLLVRSLTKLLRVDPGFDASNVLTVRLSLAPGTVAPDSVPGLYSQILDRVRAVPGVRDAAFDSCVPLGGSCAAGFLGRPGALTGDMSSLISMDWVSPNWFTLMRVPLERGRSLAATDRAGTPQVVLLNESAARKFFGADDPIGRHVALSLGGFSDAEVIGIVGGVRQRPDSAAPPIAYVPLAQSPRSGMVVFVRASNRAAAIGNEIRRAVHDVAPQLPLFDMQTMTARTASATAQARFRALLLAAFATVALLLAAIGVYGVMSFAVAARTREIGIRMALGAEGARVQRVIIAEGLGLVAAGSIVGLAGALAAARLLRTFLFDLTPGDPVTYAGVLIVLAGAALIASWIPARRASRVDPLTALRDD